MLKHTFAVILLFCALMVHAQEDISFSADRPGNSTGVDIMPQWKIQWETGVAYEWAERGNEQGITLNNSLFRLGLTNNCELRFQIDNALAHTAGGDWNYGVANVALGTKVKLFDGWKGVPKVSLMGNILMPGGKKHSFLPQHAGGQLHLLFQNDVCSWFNVGYDIGSDWNGDKANPDCFLAACFNFQPADKLSCFLESYNCFSSDRQWYDKKFLCATEIGAAYMVAPRVQIDLAADMHFNQPRNYFSVAFGVAWLIN